MIIPKPTQRKFPHSYPGVPEGRTQWNYSKQIDMVDSILRDIPMPSIVLGRTSKKDPWQLIDGQQRLSNYSRFVDDTTVGNFTLKSKEGFEDLEGLGKGQGIRLQVQCREGYSRVRQKSCQTVCQVQHFGKTMTPVQIRIAQYHEASALHHYLLGMSGGPMLLDKDEKPKDIPRKKLGIDADLQRISEYAGEIGDKFPLREKLDSDEKLVKKVTETQYDFLCKIVGYSVYRDIPRVSKPLPGDGRPDIDQPTAKIC